MNGYGFFSALRFIFFLGFIVLASLGGFAAMIGSELSREAKFRHTYGPDWQAHYEEVYGPVSKAHTRLGLSAFGFVSVSGLTVWLYRLLRPGAQASRSAGRRKARERRRFGSPQERAARQKRNAVLGIYFGVVGIALGVLLVVFRTGLFREHTNEVVLGMFVFLAGYGGVIAGCSNWLKAKQGNEALVFIGLMPLVLPMIPFVRLILLATPTLLCVGMVMMPLILIVVVAVLPDQSGASRRKHRWARGSAEWSRLQNRESEPD